MTAERSPGDAVKPGLLTPNLLTPNLLTRAEGLARLEAATQRLGRAYASRRNTAPPPGRAPTTSRLSPWLRRRLLTEEEVAAHVLAAHGPVEGEKFVQEVYWRTYFNGYLEQHPAIWDWYKAGLTRARNQPGAMRDAARAEAGQTGIACFDAWAGELRDTGWLHNHVRMWFASIWIFTLRLPWELGADFFARELIDFDPASNTLSWRWVAGLHTRGKHYVARADNIARYTEGVFDPHGQLDEAPSPLAEDEAPPRTGLPRQEALPEGPCALLLHEDDLCPETLIVPGGVAAIAVLRLDSGSTGRQRTATEVSCGDARHRAEGLLGAPAVLLGRVEEIAAWAGDRPVVMPYSPVGPLAEALAGVVGDRLLRPWDETLWPYCAKGYFQLKARI